MIQGKDNGSYGMNPLLSSKFRIFGDTGKAAKDSLLNLFLWGLKLNSKGSEKQG